MLHTKQQPVFSPKTCAYNVATQPTGYVACDNHHWVCCMCCGDTADHRGSLGTAVGCRHGHHKPMIMLMHDSHAHWQGRSPHDMTMVHDQQACPTGLSAAMIPAIEHCLVEKLAAAETSPAPIATPTFAAAKAMRSLMPSPQYMHIFPKPCRARDARCLAAAVMALHACFAHLSNEPLFLNYHCSIACVFCSPL